MSKQATGTREWAKHNVNCISGCAHNCRYCYAREMAVRFKRKTVETWPDEVVNQKAVDKTYWHREGVTMFPTTHDITPENLPTCELVIKSLLRTNNRLLIVSKPHPHVISRLVFELERWKTLIEFRFTIGSRFDNILSYWEPNAPSYEQRRDSLKIAEAAGYRTSVSIEPMLDVGDIEGLVRDLDPFVTDTIWIGKMNKIRSRVVVEIDFDRRVIEALEECQADPCIRHTHRQLKDNPKIRWKESIKKVVGLELATEAEGDA